MGVFRPQDFEWPSTPEDDNTDLGSVSDIGSDLSLGAVLGTCIITRAITGERVCDFPVDLRTTVLCAEQSASVALLRGHGGGRGCRGRVQLAHGPRTLRKPSVLLADMLSGDVLELQAVILLED